MSSPERTPSRPRPQSTIAQSFASELDNLFLLDENINKLETNVHEKKFSLSFQSNELQALEERLRRTEMLLQEKSEGHRRTTSQSGSSLGVASPPGSPPPRRVSPARKPVPSDVEAVSEEDEDEDEDDEAEEKLKAQRRRSELLKEEEAKRQRLQAQQRAAAAAAPVKKPETSSEEESEEDEDSDEEEEEESSEEESEEEVKPKAKPGAVPLPRAGGLKDSTTADDYVVVERPQQPPPQQPRSPPGLQRAPSNRLPAHRIPAFHQPYSPPSQGQQGGPQRPPNYPTPLAPHEQGRPLPAVVEKQRAGAYPPRGTSLMRPEQRGSRPVSATSIGSNASNDSAGSSDPGFVRMNSSGMQRKALPGK